MQTLRMQGAETLKLSDLKKDSAKMMEWLGTTDATVSNMTTYMGGSSPFIDGRLVRLATGPDGKLLPDDDLVIVTRQKYEDNGEVKYRRIDSILVDIFDSTGKYKLVAEQPMFLTMLTRDEAYRSEADTGEIIPYEAGSFNYELMEKVGPSTPWKFTIDLFGTRTFKVKRSKLYRRRGYNEKVLPTRLVSLVEVK